MLTQAARVKHQITYSPASLNANLMHEVYEYAELFIGWGLEFDGGTGGGGVER